MSYDNELFVSYKKDGNALLLVQSSNFDKYTGYLEINNISKFPWIYGIPDMTLYAKINNFFLLLNIISSRQSECGADTFKYNI